MLKGSTRKPYEETEGAEPQPGEGLPQRSPGLQNSKDKTPVFMTV